MTISKERYNTLYNAIKDIKDPEIGIELSKLGMIEDIDSSDGYIIIKIKLTVPGCPLAGTIEKEIKEKIKQDNVKVIFDYMTKEELEKAKKVVAEYNYKVPVSIEKYEKRKIKNVIAVYSAKGGVGKSTIVAILAYYLKNKGYNVGILDCDISGPSIKTLFNIKGFAYADENDKIQPILVDGIKIVSVDLLTDAVALIWRGPLVTSAIKQMYNDTDWGDLDYLLLDMPPGTSDGPLTVLQSIPVDSIILIVTPQTLSKEVGIKTIVMADSLKVPIIGAIENMSYIYLPNKEKIELGENISKINNISVTSHIPLIPNISISENKDIIYKELDNLFEKLPKP